MITAHYVKKRLNYNNLIILFFNYNQRTLKTERKFSKFCAKNLNARFIEIGLHYLRHLSPSLINTKKKHKKLSLKDLKDTSNESKNWYVPSRNLIFLSNALSLAENLFITQKKKYDLFVGFKNEGSENYPDTTKEFLDSLNKVSKISTEGKFKIKSPLIKKDKEDVIKLAIKMNIDPKQTFSCYTSEGIHCGTCLACRLRQEAFYWANINDPTNYKEKLKDFRLAKQ